MSNMEIQSLQDLFEVWKRTLCGLPEIKNVSTSRLGDYQVFDVETADIAGDEPAFVMLAINTNMDKKQVCREVTRFASRCFVRFNKVLPVL